MSFAQVVDIEKIIASKNPKLLKWLPGFVLSYVKRILHQDELNASLFRMKDMKGVDFAKGALDELGITVTFKGIENIPASGGVIIASNHPLGGLDGIALIYAVHQKRKDIKFLVNDILMHLEGIKDFWVPVNKHGSNGRQAQEAIDKTFASEGATLVFPAGLVSRKQNNGIEDLAWKKSFINNAIKHQRNIVPVFIHGSNSSFFYNIAYWRKKIGINANIEMFYLVDEMYKQRGKTITIEFGKPISFHVFDKTHSSITWANLVKHHVYHMGRNQSPVLPTMNV